jgi:hypothetical protein
MSCAKQVVSSAIVDKYIGESARVIREMFGYARDHQVLSFVLTFSFIQFCLYVLLFLLLRPLGEGFSGL